MGDEHVLLSDGTKAIKALYEDKTFFATMILRMVSKKQDQEKSLYVEDLRRHERTEVINFADQRTLADNELVRRDDVTAHGNA